MKKIFNLLFPLLLTSLSLGGCELTLKKEDKPLKIIAIHTQTYGIIKPIDVYTITEGYIYWKDEKVYATSLKKYYIKYYVKNKYTLSAGDTGMSIPELKFDITDWKYHYKDWKYVNFHKTLKYSYTIDIDLVETSTGYRITYYNIHDLKMDIDSATGYPREVCMDNPEKELLEYKLFKEFPVSEIRSIDYEL